MLSRRLFVSVLFFAFAVIGCGDDAQQQQQEAASNWTHESLQGPPGDAYDYRGRIGDQHFFVGAITDQVPGWHMPAQVYTTDGWKRESFPLEAGTNFDRSVQIVEADGAHFVQNAFAEQGGGELYRSDDGGSSWELATDNLPSQATRLQSDGQSLFMLGGLTEEGAEQNLHVLRSTDGGESWEEVIGGLTAPSYMAAGGWVAAPTGGTVDEPSYEVSEDSGDSWQAADVSGLANAYHDWRIYGDLAITRSTGSTNEIGVWAAADDFQWYGVAAMTGMVTELAISGDDVYVATNSGNLGRLSSAPTEWAEGGERNFENVALPHGQELQNPSPDHLSSYRRATIFGFDDGSLGALTQDGMWRTRNGGESWEPDGFPLMSTDFVIERDDSLIAGSPGRFFTRRADEETWEPMDVPAGLEGAILVELGGQIYGVQALATAESPGHPTLFSVDLAQGTAEQLWSDDPAAQVVNYLELGRPQSAHLVEYRDQLYVGSAGNQRSVLSTERRTLQPLVGGGIYVVDTDSGQSQHITESFAGDGLPLIQAMVLFDDSLWATTAGQGLWKFDPADGSGERFHRGLPTDAPGEQADVTRLVRDFAIHGDQLYAFSSRRIFVLVDRVWEELEVDDFWAEAGFDGLDPIENELDSNAILEVVPYDADRLLVAGLTGLYLLNPESGEFVRIDVDFDGGVYKIFPSDAGFYTSLWQGGLHWLEPR